MNKNKIGFFLAFIGMSLLSVFIYLGYPKLWRDNPIINASLLLVHVLGILSTCAIFLFYKKLNHETIKKIISYCGSIYYIFMLNMAVITTIKFIIRIIYDIGILSEHFSSFTEFIENDQLYETTGMMISYVISIVGFINANHTFMRRYDININKPSNIKSLNIMLIADIHMGSGTWKNALDKLLFHINKARPDIILIAGDLIDETTSDIEIEDLKRFTKKLNPQYGIYMALGNHDNACPEYLKTIKNETNIKIASDEKIMIGDVQLIIRPDYKSDHILPEDLSEKLNINTEKPVIILQHRPNEFIKLGKQNYDLVMAGHTHGFNLTQSINISINSDLIQGKKIYGNMIAIVTSGVAGWGFHYKFPAISEIINIRLNFKNNKKEKENE